MKRMLKRLGVLGLILALIAPFTKLPIVNAEESTNCTKHLQNYMFLDANWMGSLIQLSQKEYGTFLDLYNSKNSYQGYKTYTKFPYAFSQKENSKVTVNWIETNSFNDVDKTLDEIDDYWRLASKKNEASDIKSSLTTDWYNRYTGNEELGAVFIQEKTAGTYEDKTIIFHGVWSSAQMNGQPTNEEAKNIDYDTLNELEAASIQNVLKPEDLKYINATISSAGYKNGFEVSYKNFDVSYFQDIVDGTLNPTSDSNTIIPVSINRSITFKDSSTNGINLNNYIFGYKEADGTVVIFTEVKSPTQLSDITDSYTAFVKFLENTNSTSRYEDYTINSSGYSWINYNDIDFDNTKQYYWPVVLTLEYEVCPLKDEEKPVEKWSVTYNDNVSDAEINVPAKQEANLGTKIKLSETIPTRSGYTFKQWCESGNGSGQCYNPGKEMDSPKEKTNVTLYAIWGATNTVENPKQGVISYIIGFAAVGLVAGGIYLISKRKSLFKQI